MKTKETDDGIFEWVDCGYGAGFWSKVEDKQIQHDRIPVGCRACGDWIDNWDKTYHLRYGVCSDCYIEHLEGRTNLPDFKNNDARAEYVKQKIAEKNKQS